MNVTTNNEFEPSRYLCSLLVRENNCDRRTQELRLEKFIQNEFEIEFRAWLEGAGPSIEEIKRVYAPHKRFFSATLKLRIFDRIF